MSEQKKVFKPSGDERTKNLLDEAQQLRNLLAASIRRGKERRKKRRERSSPKNISNTTEKKNTQQPMISIC